MWEGVVCVGGCSVLCVLLNDQKVKIKPKQGMSLRCVWHDLCPVCDVTAAVALNIPMSTLHLHTRQLSLGRMPWCRFETAVSYEPVLLLHTLSFLLVWKHNGLIMENKDC